MSRPAPVLQYPAPTDRGAPSYVALWKTVVDSVDESITSPASSLESTTTITYSAHLCPLRSTDPSKPTTVDKLPSAHNPILYTTVPLKTVLQLQELEQLVVAAPTTIVAI